MELPGVVERHARGQLLRQVNWVFPCRVMFVMIAVAVAWLCG